MTTGPRVTNLGARGGDVSSKGKNVGGRGGSKLPALPKQRSGAGTDAVSEPQGDAPLKKAASEDNFGRRLVAHKGRVPRNTFAD
jgi:hypothetical protein